MVDPDRATPPPWLAPESAPDDIRRGMARNHLDRDGGGPSLLTVKWRSVRALIERLFG